MECAAVYAPGWIHYKHGKHETVLLGHWAALYRMMVKADGEATASEEFWSFFEDPEYSLGLIEKNSGYLSPQITAASHKDISITN